MHHFLQNKFPRNFIEMRSGEIASRKILTATQNPEKLELYASVCRQTRLPVDPIKLLEKLTRGP